MNINQFPDVRHIFMSPEDYFGTKNMTTPPKLRNGTDRLLWREAVFELAKNLKARESYEDNGAKAEA